MFPVDSQGPEPERVEAQELAMVPDSQCLEKDKASIERGTLTGEVDLAQSFRYEGQLNPLTVHRDGTTYFVVDGLHRLEAARQARRRRFGP